MFAVTWNKLYLNWFKGVEGTRREKAPTQITKSHFLIYFSHPTNGFPGGSDGIESAFNVGDVFNPCVGKIHWGGHGNPLQYSRLENSMDRGAWRAAVHGAAKSDTAERLHTASTHPTKALLTEVWLVLNAHSYTDSVIVLHLHSSLRLSTSLNTNTLKESSRS